MRRAAGVALLVAWTLTLAVVLAGLLSVPAPLAPADLSWVATRAWIADQGAAVAAVGVVRVGAIALAAYLLVATVASVLARAVAAPFAVRVADAATVPFAVRVADAATVPFVRRLVAGALGASLSVAALTPAPARAAPPPPPAAVPGDEAPVMRWVPDPPADTARPGPRPLLDHVVQPGESFWTVAEAVVGASAREAGEHATARYWRRLIEANRARLADPANPDLLFPGQVLTLPPLDG